MISKIYSNPCCKPTKQKKKRRDKEIQRIARAFSRELEEKATPAERAFAEMLAAHGIRFDFQHPFRRGKTFAIVDFWLPDYGVIVEIDGGYHNEPQQFQRDTARSADLMRKEKVRRVVRFTNEQAMGDDDPLLKELARQIVPWASKFVR